ncbi:MAG: hypothetical protein ACI4QW_03230 [Clostridia bacterium]
MEKFFSDLKQTVNSAVKKSGELVELTKIKIAVGDTKNAIRTNFEKLGELAYLAAKGDDAQGTAEELVSAIDELKETLNQQEAKLAELSNKKICSHCGKASSEDSAFCSACGNPFGDAE